jgi:sec-independent protein translocase protein TatA
MFGWQELILVLAIALIIFGGKRLKNIGNDIGGAIKGFKSSMKDTDAEKKEDIIEAKVEVEADDESSDKKS